VTYDAGKLYVQKNDGNIYRFNAADGHQDWTFNGQTDGNSVGSLLVTGNSVIWGTSSSDEWAGDLAAGAYIGKVWSVTKDGQPNWSHKTIDGTAGNGGPVWSSPSVDLDTGIVYVTSGNNYTAVGGDAESIIALKLATGDRIWGYRAVPNDLFTSGAGASGKDFDFGANPILFEAGGKKLVGAGSKSGTFYTVDRASGDPVWSRKITEGCIIGGILNNGAFDGKNIYVSSFPCTWNLGAFPPYSATLTSGKPVVAALNAADGSIKWQKELVVDQNAWGPITAANGVVYVPAGKQLLAFNAETGDVLFTFDGVGSIASAPVVVDGMIYFGSGVPSDQALGKAGVTDGHTLYALGL
jgi:polyvinyl alcohol dehydrogenase (cytochrome)